ncbi:hypothetical protein C8J32_1232 [Rhizobium sp. PP-CC-3A-592]|nr:hypothetical protein C8J32_1232 [Rhizobium sp. PP-CC-3A-592]
MSNSEWEWAAVEGHEGLWVLDGKTPLNARATAWADIDKYLKPRSYRWAVGSVSAFSSFDGECKTLGAAKADAFEAARKADEKAPLAGWGKGRESLFVEPEAL